MRPRSVLEGRRIPGRSLRRIAAGIVAAGIGMSVLWTAGAGVVILWPAASAAQSLTRGPYLGVGTTSGVVIRWRTNVATDSRVRYGISHLALDSSIDDPALTTEHVVQVSGLNPDTRYFYSVGTTTGVLAGGDLAHFFTTSPAPGPPRQTRVWVIGDSGLPGAGAAGVRDAYLNYTGSRATDVWLMLGDNAYSIGTDAQYQAAVFDMYPQLLRNTVLWPTRGNHDVIFGGANNDYYDIFTMPTAGEAGGLASGTEAYYSFDYANVHFICLDSQGSSRLAIGPMLTWLGLDLAATSQDWIVAFWHHPPYTKGSHDSDNVADSGGRMRDMRENALPILEAGGVDLVLGGHSHSYERSYLIDEHYGVSTTLHDTMRINTGDGNVFGDGAYLKTTLGPGAHEGTVYAVAGSSSRLGGGALNHPVMVTSLSALGSMVLDIDAAQLDAVFIDNAGAIRDGFTIIKGMTATALGERVPRADPRLSTGAPNPFAVATRLGYSLPGDGPANLSIYDVRGRRVATLVDATLPAGDYTALWDGRRADGRRLARGVYFGVLRFGGETRTRKIVYVR
ncbi:MAG: metallophosphoesterase [Candidatus Krumholzibacteriia bacterium]